MKKVMRILSVFVAAGVLVSGCFARSGVSPTTPGAAATANTISRPTAAPVQSEWERFKSEASKEGKLRIVGTALGDTKQVISEVFRDKFGVDIEYIDGRGSEVAAKVVAERRAGLYFMDVGHTGDITYFKNIRPLNMSVPLEPFLFLPEVVDAKKWRGGALPWNDKDKHLLSMDVQSVVTVIFNTNMVDENEIASNTDLLNPRWKGKIVLGDPATAGTGNNWFTQVVTRLYPSRELGLEFMRQFAKQSPVITRDNRLQIEWVAKGKYPIAVGPSNAVLAQFKKVGAPIGIGVKKDKPPVSAGAGNVYVFDRAPHPNATKLYVNWILSQEGANLWAHALGYASLRVDVVNDHMDPELIPPEDVTVKGEEFIKLQDEMLSVAKEIFKDLRQ